MGDTFREALREGLARVLALDVRPLVHVSFCEFERYRTDRAVDVGLGVRGLAQRELVAHHSIFRVFRLLSPLQGFSAEGHGASAATVFLQSVVCSAALKLYEAAATVLFAPVLGEGVFVRIAEQRTGSRLPQHLCFLQRASLRRQKALNGFCKLEERLRGLPCLEPRRARVAQASNGRR